MQEDKERRGSAPLGSRLAVCEPDEHDDGTAARESDDRDAHGESCLWLWHARGDISAFPLTLELFSELSDDR